MKKILLFSLSCFLISSLIAQDSTLTTAPAPVKKKKVPIDLSGRASDHLLVQFGYTGWSGALDSVNPSVFSKSFNMYFMFDFPFKTNPTLSMAVGGGISSDHIIFKRTYVGIKDITETIQFLDQSDTNHFKKTKLNTTYLEAPIEFR